MSDILKLTHLAAGIVWMGGMAALLLALRPAALSVLEPPVRARLMAVVWQRFFVVVMVCAALLLATGTHLYTAAFRVAKAATGVGNVPLGWSLMLGLGMLMMLIFGHLYFGSFRRFKAALAAGEGPVAAQAAAQIHTLVLTNFVLGWLAIAAVRLVH